MWVIFYLYDYFLSGISYSEVNFTLNQLLCIPLAVVLSCSFGGQKNMKERVEEKYKSTIKVEDCCVIQDE